MNLDDLREFAPGGRPDLLRAIADHWDVARRAGINTPLRICHFMAQMHVESMGFRKTEEDLSYSAKRLQAVWPKRFPTAAAAAPFAKNPRALANHVYGGRMGNRGESSDDGWRYRGRGPKQITGRANYQQIGDDIDVDLEADPELLLDPVIGFKAAVAFWKRAGCNRDADRNDIRAVTKRVNGGYNGLADRRAAFRSAVRIWGEDEVSEIGGKGPANSNTGRAVLAGGAAGIAALAEQGREVADLVNSGMSIWDSLYQVSPTAALLLLIGGVLIFIFRDRLFIAENEGL